MAHLTLFHTRDYRGATVEDLDIQPALSIYPSTSLEETFAIAYENQFSFLPVINEANKKLLGVLSINSVSREKANRSVLKPIVQHYMVWFNNKTRKEYEHQLETGSLPRGVKPSSANKINLGKKLKSKRYEILTPNSPLEQLSKFFNEGNLFAVITSREGDLVYGVSTPEDLMKYENSRPRL